MFFLLCFVFVFFWGGGGEGNHYIDNRKMMMMMNVTEAMAFQDAVSPVDQCTEEIKLSVRTLLINKQQRPIPLLTVD